MPSGRVRVTRPGALANGEDKRASCPALAVHRGHMVLLPEPVEKVGMAGADPAAAGPAQMDGARRAVAPRDPHRVAGANLVLEGPMDHDPKAQATPTDERGDRRR